jgi:hypothetical protein
MPQNQFRLQPLRNAIGKGSESFSNLQRLKA